LLYVSSFSCFFLFFVEFFLFCLFISRYCCKSGDPGRSIVFPPQALRSRPTSRLSA
jgi:hypothetical protein